MAFHETLINVNFSISIYAQHVGITRCSCPQLDFNHIVVPAISWIMLLGCYIFVAICPYPDQSIDIRFCIWLMQVGVTISITVYMSD